MRGIEIDRVRAENYLFWECDDRLTWFLCGWWRSKLTRFFRIRAANRLVLVWASKLTWLLSSCRYWLDFSVVDQTWPDFSLGIGIDLFCVWGSKMSWFYSIWIDIDLDLVWRCSTAYIYGVLTDRWVCYVLESHSVTVDWVAQWFILYKRTKEVHA